MIVACSCPPRPRLVFTPRRFASNLILPTSPIEPLTPVFATHPQNPLVTPFLATHTILPACKSFPCHTYKKQGGIPLWECGGLAAAFTVTNPELPVSISNSSRYLITSLLHRLISSGALQNEIRQAVLFPPGKNLPAPPTPRGVPNPT